MPSEGRSQGLAGRSPPAQDPKSPTRRLHRGDLTLPPAQQRVESVLPPPTPKACTCSSLEKVGVWARPASSALTLVVWHWHSCVLGAGSLTLAKRLGALGSAPPRPGTSPVQASSQVRLLAWVTHPGSRQSRLPREDKACFCVEMVGTSDGKRAWVCDLSWARPYGAPTCLTPTEAWRPLSQGGAGSAKVRNERRWRTCQCQEILDMRDLAAFISDLQTFPQTTNSSTWEWDRAVILRQGSITVDYFMWLLDVLPCYSVCRWCNESIWGLPIRH